MIFFVFGRFFERHPPRRQTDALPTEPLIEMMAFWSLLALGGLMGSMAFVLDGWLVPVLAVMAVVCLTLSIRFWRRLNR
jgi:CHASE2 domain-containing sensor protein